MAAQDEARRLRWLWPLLLAAAICLAFWAVVTPHPLTAEERPFVGTWRIEVENTSCPTFPERAFVYTLCPNRSVVPLLIEGRRVPVDSDPPDVVSRWEVSGGQFFDIDLGPWE